MYWLLALMALSLLGIIGLGIFYEMYPPTAQNPAPRWWKNTVALNLFTFFGTQVGLLLLGMHEVMATEAATVGAVAAEISIGKGLAMIGVGIPTAVATIAAGIAVGPVGAASLAVIAEKPEVFGRTLVYLGLAEGIAIYGLVVTILMLGRL